LGLAVHIGILIINSVLKGVGHATDLADLGNMIFSLATFAMLVVWTIKAWRGKPVHVESVDDLTEWLEDKIKPR
jgi:membrane protein CcdC involved in cytochrome C biogenesis